MTPQVGQTWEFHCVGTKLLFLLLDENCHGSFDVLILDEGRVSRYHSNPKQGSRPGEWEYVF